MIPASTQGLEFDQTTHTYRFNGQVVPGVTQIIEATGLSDFSSVPESILERAQWRGSAVHLACHFLDENDLNLETVDAAHLGYIEAWKACKLDMRLRNTKIEKRVYNPVYGYAGTLDRQIEYSDVLDLKTGDLQAATAIQLAAYVMCLPDPYTWRRLAVRLKPDGKYVVKQYQKQDLARDFAVFQAALTLFRWKEAHP